MIDKITVIAKCSGFPGYVVLAGEIRENGNGGVWTSLGEVNPQEVLATYPISHFPEEQNRLLAIHTEYLQKLKQLQLDILKDNGVDFL